MIEGITDFGILSLVLSILASIFLGIGITRYVRKLDNKRRNSEEMYYKKLVCKNISSINKIFVQLSEITIEYDETRSDEMGSYFENKKQLIQDLIHDTNMYIIQWKSLPTTYKNDLELILKSLKWLTDEYYPIDKPLAVRKIRCHKYMPEFDEKKDMVVKVYDKLIAKYNTHSKI